MYELYYNIFNLYVIADEIQKKNAFQIKTETF